MEKPKHKKIQYSSKILSVMAVNLLMLANRSDEVVEYVSDMFAIENKNHGLNIVLNLMNLVKFTFFRFFISNKFVSFTLITFFY